MSNVIDAPIDQLEVSLAKLQHRLATWDSRTDDKMESERNGPVYKWVKDQIHRIECEILERSLLK